MNHKNLVKDVKLTQFIRWQNYARLILGLILSYLVYTETGLWTGITIILILIMLELFDIYSKIVVNQLKLLQSMVQNYIGILERVVSMLDKLTLKQQNYIGTLERVVSILDKLTLKQQNGK